MHEKLRLMCIFVVRIGFTVMPALPEHLSNEYAPVFKDRLLGMAGIVNEGGMPLIDLSHVQRISFSCLQILLAGSISAQKQGGCIAIKPSEAVMHAAKTCGIYEYIVFQQ